jgi:hypothetical protein
MRVIVTQWSRRCNCEVRANALSLRRKSACNILHIGTQVRRPSSEAECERERRSAQTKCLKRSVRRVFAARDEPASTERAVRRRAATVRRQAAAGAIAPTAADSRGAAGRGRCSGWEALFWGLAPFEIYEGWGSAKRVRQRAHRMLVMQSLRRLWDVRVHFALSSF